MRKELLFVLTKDIGDFEPMIHHRWRPSSPEVVDGLQLQRVERAANGLQPLQRHPQIPGGAPDVGMPEQHLDGAEIGAGIQHVRGARMPEQVGINRASDTGPLSSVAAGTDGLLTRSFAH